MSLLTITDDENEAVIDTNAILGVLKPIKRAVTDPKGNLSERYILKVLIDAGHAITLLYIEEDDAMCEYQEILAAFYQSRAPVITMSTGHIYNNTGTGQPIDWERLNKSYTPGNPDVSFTSER